MRQSIFNSGISRELRAIKLAVATAALAFTFIGGLFAYGAISAEVTGEAIYRNRGYRRAGEAVTRETSPSKFRDATAENWAASGVCTILATAFFVFYRKIDDYA